MTGTRVTPEARHSRVGFVHERDATAPPEFADADVVVVQEQVRARAQLRVTWEAGASDPSSR